MIKENVQQELNKQINAELYSAYLYLSMSAYFESVNLGGMATWMRAQAQEEVTHAMKMYNFLFETGGEAKMLPIEGPQTQWTSPLAAFEGAYDHEKKVTGMINTLVDLAVQEKDHATNNMLQWFVAEQVEEEDSAKKVVDQLRLIGENKNSLFMLDKELGQRVFTPEPSGEEVTK